MDLNIYLFIVLIIRRIYCLSLSSEQLYVRSKEDRKYTNTVLEESTLRSLTRCAGTCLITPGCQDFSFSENYCKLYGVSDNSQPPRNMTLFTKVAASFDPRIFPGGILYTYAYIPYREIHRDTYEECEKLGSRLLMIDSAEKFLRIQAVLMLLGADNLGAQDVHVDGHRANYSAEVDPRDNWYFANGEIVPYEVWPEGSPSSNQGDQCVKLWVANAFVFAADSCSIPLPFICEK